MKVASVLGLAIITLSLSAQAVPGTVCGKFENLPSCGPQTVVVPVVKNESGVYNLQSTCDRDTLYVCDLRSSIIGLLANGDEVCVMGEVIESQASCFDHSIIFTSVSKSVSSH